MTTRITGTGPGDKSTGKFRSLLDKLAEICVYMTGAEQKALILILVLAAIGLGTRFWHRNLRHADAMIISAGENVDER